MELWAERRPTAAAIINTAMAAEVEIQITIRKVNQEINHAAKQGTTINGTTVPTIPMKEITRVTRATRLNGPIGMNQHQKERFDSKTTIVAT